MAAVIAAESAKAVFEAMLEVVDGETVDKALVVSDDDDDVEAIGVPVGGGVPGEAGKCVNGEAGGLVD